MRLKYQLRLLITILAVSSVALPVAAQASGGKRYCGGWGKGGIIYNETQGMYMRAPCTKSGYVYRSVDLKYIKVTKYCSCKSGTCHKHMVNVSCTMQPGFWWGTTWHAPYNECWYVR